MVWTNLQLGEPNFQGIEDVVVLLNQRDLSYVFIRFSTGAITLKKGA